MQRNSRIYVAGHRGLVGSALVRRLKAKGYANLVLQTSQELDLRDPMATMAFFEREQPDFVFLAAAKVGGIQANNRYPADFITDNLAIQNNVFSAATRMQVRKLIFLGSSCIYPRECPQPISEDYLLTGPLETTNEAYAIAKIAGLHACWAYNRQYGTDYLAVMPTNLYGPGDNYDLANSHVLPAFIRKLHEAKERKASEVTFWGTGTPRREFLYSDDLADACIFLMEGFSASELGKFVNIGSGKDLSIRELAEVCAEIVGFKGRILWDSSQPDGTPRKLLDVGRMTSLGWTPRVELRDGIAMAYRSYLETLQAEIRA
ncbi:GDP-L-fucose synthase [compost metagenome]